MVAVIVGVCAWSGGRSPIASTQPAPAAPAASPPTPVGRDLSWVTGAPGTRLVIEEERVDGYGADRVQRRLEVIVAMPGRPGALQPNATAMA